MYALMVLRFLLPSLKLIGPAIEGLSLYKGTLVHTAGWNKDID